MSELADRVERGIEILNDKYPAWVLDVDLGDLALNDVRHCVIGQLAYARGEIYDEVIDWLSQRYRPSYNGLSKDVEFAYEYGFDVEDEADYDELQELWETHIAQLQFQAVEDPTPAQVDHIKSRL